MSASTSPPESAASGSAEPLPVLRTGDVGVPRGDEIAAAVLVPLFRASDTAEPHVVLTRRRSDLRSHAGEISFPGGRRDDEDTDLLGTALREAEEEIGLDRSQVKVIGGLPATSTFVTGYVIHPYVGAIPPGISWVPSAREVETILELPLEALRAGHTLVQLERRGFKFETDAYVVGDAMVWGATARILDHLFERLEPGSLSLLPD